MRARVTIYRPQITLLPGDRVSRPDAAAYLNKSPLTLWRWAKQGIGPPFMMVDGRAEYDFGGLKAYRANGGSRRARRSQTPRDL